jgi:hypothetical protein
LRIIELPGPVHRDVEAYAAWISCYLNGGDMSVTTGGQPLGDLSKFKRGLICFHYRSKKCPNPDH